jgi:hypothetical protein
MMQSNRLKTYHFLPWVDGNGITSPRVQKLTGSWQNDGGGDAFVVVPLHPNGTTVLDRGLTRGCELYSPLLVGGRMVQHGVQGFLADSKSLLDYLNRDLIINRVSGEHDFPSGWRGLPCVNRQIDNDLPDELSITDKMRKLRYSRSGTPSSNIPFDSSNAAFLPPPFTSGECFFGHLSEVGLRRSS